MRKFYLLLSILVIYGCNPTEIKLSAQEIIDKAIVATGVEKVSNARVSFDFRDRTYIADRNTGLFSLQRLTNEDGVVVKDELTNRGFKRFKNDTLVSVIDSMAIKYSESVNSVHYFATLPYGLNDGAVQKKMLGQVVIKNKEYYKIEVTFKQEGGGIDYQDVFIYWINKEGFSIDYLAYKFHVNGGGVRFREAIKTMEVNGIFFSNYNNYKPKDETVLVSELDTVFEAGNLIKLSEINLENIKVVFKKP